MKKVLILIIFLSILRPLKANDLDYLKCWPVPFSPYSSTLFVIAQIDSPVASVKYNIFTLTGDLVYNGNLTIAGGQGVQQLVTWNGQNNNGRYVADGGYIIQIQASSQNGTVTKYLKFLVIKDK